MPSPCTFFRTGWDRGPLAQSPVTHRGKLWAGTPTSPAPQRREGWCSSSKPAPASPPGTQDPLGAMWPTGFTRNRILGSPPRSIPGLVQREQTLPPNTSWRWDGPRWDVSLFPCKAPWLETSCAPTTEKKAVGSRGCVSQLCSSCWRGRPARYPLLDVGHKALYHNGTYFPAALPPLSSVGCKIWSRAGGANEEGPVHLSAGGVAALANMMRREAAAPEAAELSA